ncbi:MAG: response regulator transcription factor [Clostridium sp.]|nr:MAG: response regulator transcription factor [Clostridium sp.]
MLPKIDGFEVCKIIRSSSNIPIIMMTALGEEQNMLYGYSLKVDDYIIKPFPPKVLVAKVNNLLSRIQKPEELIKIYEVGGIKIDYNANIAYVDNKKISLSKTEFDLLCFFIQKSR